VLAHSKVLVVSEAAPAPAVHLQVVVLPVVVAVVVPPVALAALVSSLE